MSHILQSQLARARRKSAWKSKPMNAPKIIRITNVIIEEAVAIKQHLRQGDPVDVHDLATNIEGLAQQLQEFVHPHLGDPNATTILREQFADLV